MNFDKTSKPFLRWAGGKNWFVKLLPSILGSKNFSAYYEPFLGGGSVFFALQPERAFLSDLNEDLTTAYQGVRDDVGGVIDRLGSWDVSEQQYYAIRSAKPKTIADKAARFIYLNQTSFNGIWRVNRKGQYNVPYGHRDTYIFDFERIRKCSLALQGATIMASSFETALSNVKENSLVFLDPPYTVSHNNNGFIEYNKTLFSLENQKTLRRSIEKIDDAGAFFIMTNAAHQSIKDIFNGIGHMEIVSRSCTLGGKNAKRGSTEEYVFTNIPDALTGDRQ